MTAVGLGQTPSVLSRPPRSGATPLCAGARATAGVGATPAPPIVCQASGRAGHEPTERLQRLEQARRAPVKAWRGVPCTVAVTLVADLGDLTRVEPPRHVMHARGLLPAASSRGARRRQGAIPTTGHPQARRAVVEGAGAARHPATVRRHVPRRRAPGPHATHVGGAIARALAGVLGAIAPQVAGTPSLASLGRQWTRHPAGWPRLWAEAPPR